ncbi:Mpv17/PMP22 family protein [Phanerochaete sordida]|uniref:Mpv17/PMP22 family protein n=1 Tax=Phanerochaete sordida TaxID=48140 RepID=A0A9P3G254_9APHY|nr:Mpv17/PMP22 family protein [Phanerochaete sordida]
MSSTRVAYPTTVSTPAGSLVSKQRANTLLRSLLQAYLRELSAHPLRTKCFTVGTFNFVQDILGNHLAGVPPRRVPKDAPFYEKLAAALKLDARAFKMAIYGFCVSAPLSHYTTGTLQRMFAGKTNTLFGKLAQILTSLLVQSPMVALTYLSCTAIINGARTKREIMDFVKPRFMGIIKISMVSTPFGMLVAQYCLPPELWVPWFNGITFCIGTTLSVMIKRGAVKQHRDQLKKDEKKD